MICNLKNGYIFYLCFKSVLCIFYFLFKNNSMQFPDCMPFVLPSNTFLTYDPYKVVNFL